MMRRTTVTLVADHATPDSWAGARSRRFELSFRDFTRVCASCHLRAGILKEMSTECLGNIGVEVPPNIVFGPLG